LGLYNIRLKLAETWNNAWCIFGKGINEKLGIEIQRNIKP